MTNQREYSRPAVSGPGCNYANLQGYNQNYFGRGRVTIPQISGSRSAQIVVTPSYGGNGYGALNNGLVQGQGLQKSCNGYFSISNGYPNFPYACGAFSSNLCG